MLNRPAAKPYKKGPCSTKLQGGTIGRTCFDLSRFEPSTQLFTWRTRCWCCAWAELPGPGRTNKYVLLSTTMLITIYSVVRYVIWIFQPGSIGGGRQTHARCTCWHTRTERERERHTHTHTHVVRHVGTQSPAQHASNREPHAASTP